MLPFRINLKTPVSLATHEKWVDVAWNWTLLKLQPHDKFCCLHAIPKCPGQLGMELWMCDMYVYASVSMFVCTCTNAYTHARECVQVCIVARWFDWISAWQTWISKCSWLLCSCYHFYTTSVFHPGVYYIYCAWYLPMSIQKWLQSKLCISKLRNLCIYGRLSISVDYIISPQTHASLIEYLSTVNSYCVILFYALGWLGTIKLGTVYLCMYCGAYSQVKLSFILNNTCIEDIFHHNAEMHFDILVRAMLLKSWH